MLRCLVLLLASALVGTNLLCAPITKTQGSREKAKKQLQDFGAILSFDLAGGKRSLNSFFERLKLIPITAGLGSVETVAAPSFLFFAKDFNTDDRARCGIAEGTVRLSVGIEDSDDLIADLDQALGA